MKTYRIIRPQPNFSRLDKKKVEEAIRWVADVRSVHVVPADGRGWSVKSPKGASPLKNFPTKDKAVKYAKLLSGRQNKELVVYKRDGSIEHSRRLGKLKY